jgi:molecular chaperone GrpE
MIEKISSEQEKEEKIAARLFEVPAKAVILKEGKVLLLKRASGHIRSAGMYDFPGGAVERGEKISDGLKREVKEETGLEVEVRQVISVADSEKEYSLDGKGGKMTKVFTKCIGFLAYYKSGEIRLSDEHQSYEWLSVDDAIKKFDEKDQFYVILKQILVRAEEFLENQNALDSWKRCQADFENFKKDQARHQEEFRKYAKIDVIEQILPVVDNFESSLAHVPEKSQENKWVEGIVYIKKQLEDILRNNNIEEIEVKTGDKFNPEIHEAVGGDGKKQKVARVVQKGYKLNGRVIRAARVEVE